MMHEYYSKELQIKYSYLDNYYHAVEFPFKSVFCPLLTKVEATTYVSWIIQTI